MRKMKIGREYLVTFKAGPRYRASPYEWWRYDRGPCVQRRRGSPENKPEGVRWRVCTSWCFGLHRHERGTSGARSRQNMLNSWAHRGQMRGWPQQRKACFLQIVRRGASSVCDLTFLEFWPTGFAHLSLKVPPPRTRIGIWMLGEPMDAVARYLFSVPGGGPCRQLV